MWKLFYLLKEEIQFNAVRENTILTLLCFEKHDYYNLL